MFICAWGLDPAEPDPELALLLGFVRFKGVSGSERGCVGGGVGAGGEGWGGGERFSEPLAEADALADMWARWAVADGIQCGGIIWKTEIFYNYSVRLSLPE